MVPGVQELQAQQIREVEAVDQKPEEVVVVMCLVVPA
jgi:hypothetical protein